MAELATLKSKKSALKGKVTRLRNYFDSINKDQLNDNIINELQTRLERVQPIYEEFDDIQFQIEQNNTNDEGCQPDEAERGAFEDAYFKLIGEIGVMLRNHMSNALVASNSVISSRHSATSQGLNSLQTLVKLPPIKLPTFDGQYSNWLEFKDLFIALVYSNNSLNGIQKFYYLRSSLSREVLEIIKSIEVSDSNYDIAWQFLTDRFENKKLIIYNPSLIKESYIELRNLYDSVTKHLRALKTLGENTDAWDRLIIYIMSSKFDVTTRRDWETYKYQDDLPTMSDLNNFLKFRCEILEKMQVSSNRETESNKYKNPSLTKIKGNISNSYPVSEYKSDNIKYKCYYCNRSHSIFKCYPFLKLPINERITAIKQLKLCLNCLRDSHPSWKCKKPKCNKCNKAHSTLLHFDSYNKSQDQNSGITDNLNNVPPIDQETQQHTPAVECTGGTPNVSLNSYISKCTDSDSSPLVFCAGSSAMLGYSQVLLSTAMIQLTNNTKTVTARALLDSGSQSNFISKSMCNKLNLQQSKINHAVKGVGQILTNINTQVNLTIKSCVNNFKSNIMCLVLSTITDKLPLMSFNKDILKIPSKLQLADPNFNLSGDIDILLGSNVFWSIMGSNQVRLGSNMPILQETEFGYIIAGNLSLNLISPKKSISCLNMLDSDTSIDNKIVKFWEIEEVNNKVVKMSDSEKYCERYFQESVTRDQTGRFVVRIPFKCNLDQLGDSWNMALNRFNLLEKKLEKNPNLKNEYISFISEYINLGHMSEINDKRGEGCYLPHHAVIKNSSLTTKSRVVFDASAKTTTGLSLNDVQLVGPTIQQDMFSILTRFRIYQYVMTGDISKMYRQILINPSETNYQTIFWRSQPNESIKVYKLNTVTYGTASAPYLAVRCLAQIAKEIEIKFPLISKIIKRDFYMDDLLTGSKSMEELLQIQRDIVRILVSYGFELRKFLCSNKDLLNNFQTKEDIYAKLINVGANDQNKTLGLIAPIIIIAKLIIQELWDDEIPSALLKTWNSFYNNLFKIGELKIPRCTIFSQYLSIEMHGFCDASIKAYGACIYLRCSTSGKYYSRLLCAKSRVAPLKQISLPRLELCGALLLANLVKRVKDALEINLNRLYYWTDSTIILCWIRNESNKWKTFVANRVSEIRSLTDFKNWNHVRSTDNPADLLSRGESIEVLNKSNLWWYGPEWFKVEASNWNITESEFKTTVLIEQRSVSHSAISYSNEIINILYKFSSFRKTLGVIAYILRFLSNIKLNAIDRNDGPLLPEELDKH